MGAINENVYGATEDWVSAPYYPDEIPRANRVLLANFGEDNSTIEKAMTEDLLPLGAAWDNTLSYAALGAEHPLSKIQYFYYDHEAAEPKKLQVLNADDRTITNYALGVDGTPGLTDILVTIVAGAENSSNKARYNRYNDGAEFDNTYSGYKSFKPFTQIPVKRCILVPYVKAYYSDFSYGTTFDLEDYVTNRKASYPNITQISLSIITDRNDTYDPDEGTGTPSRGAYSGLTGGVILEPLTYGNGYTDPSVGVKTDNAYRPIISVAIAGALYDKDLPANQTSSTWCVPVASGFGLDFTKIFDSVDGAINDNNESRFYCDATLYSADDIREAVRHMTACYGLFFADSLSDAQTKKLDDPAIMLGTLVEGVGHGAYTSGADNKQQQQWNMDDIHEVDYDPSNPPAIDPNTYDGSMQSNDLAFLQTATSRYNLTYVSFINLCSKLWDAMALITPGDPVNDYCLNEFLTQNPIDTIVSVKYFPISESLVELNTAVNLHLGKYDTGISCYPAKSSLRVDCGSLFIFPRFGKNKPNWLDLMTTITLYLPFCGTLQLDPEKYMNRWVNVEYAIDLVTGNCSAFVSVHGDALGPVDGLGGKVITDIASGNCGIELPVTGIQHITLESQLYNATENLKALRVNGAISGLQSLLGVGKAASGNDMSGGLQALGSAGSTIYNVLHSEEVAEYNLQHTQLPVKMIGTTGSMTGGMCELHPTIIFERPVVPDINESAYAHTVGYACCRSGKVSSFSGYTEFASVQLEGFSGTSAEKSMILNQLKAGVII